MELSLFMTSRMKALSNTSLGLFPFIVLSFACGIFEVNNHATLSSCGFKFIQKACKDVFFSRWLDNIKEKITDDISVIVVGNKSDDQSRRMILHSAGEQLAQDHGFEHFEVSAKTGKNIEDLFFRMAKILLENQAKLAQQKCKEATQDIIKLQKRSKNKKKKKC